jgi:hypothetical protein
MIVRVDNKKQLKKFIYFVKELYKNEENYVFPFFSIQKKELTKYVLKEKTYYALMYIENNKVLGRILYTFREDNNKVKKCYFSSFDFYNNLEVAKKLIDEMQIHAKNNNCYKLEGPYCPYDPDTRRGVLTNNFSKLPSVFLTYNYPYYCTIYEKLGFYKVIDTLSFKIDLNEKVYKKIKLFNKLSTNNIEISCLNRKDIKNEIKAVTDVMREASTQMNYTDAPSYKMVESIFKSMKFLLEDEFIIIAREKESKKAVGIVICIPELNQVFCKLKGKLNIISYLKHKKNINKVRGWLQYVIPKYQKTPLLASMFGLLGDGLQKRNIIEFEGGTIVEENINSFKVFEHFGGVKDKIYRIYGRG